MATKDEILAAVEGLAETLGEIADVQDEINERLSAIESEMGIDAEPEDDEAEGCDCDCGDEDDESSESPGRCCR